jgi:uncharacterized membrane protein YvbJ
MRCPNCDFENRQGTSFCEECGNPLAEPTAAQEGIVCAECGFSNRSDVRFCGYCGEPLANEDVQACTNCGHLNRPEVRFCEECGKSLVAKVVRSRKPIRKTPASLSRKKRIGYGSAVIAILLVVAFLWLRPDQAQRINDFDPAIQEIRHKAVETASEYADDWAPWVDPDSATISELDTTEGIGHMVTFEQKDGGNEDFGPKLIVVFDALTGDTLFIEAP